MNLPVLIAWRYVRRPTDRLVSAAGLTSLLGLVIGVMALVIAMALMTGYRLDLERKLLGGNAEIFLYPPGGEIEDLAGTLSAVRALEGVAEASPVVFQHGLISSESSPSGEQITLKGIEADRAAHSDVIRRILGDRDGFRHDGEPGVAVGENLAKRLQLEEGMPVTIAVPSRAGTFLPRASTFVVTSVYRTGFHQFDSAWIFLDIDDARSLTGLTESANLVEFHLEPGTDLDAAAARISRATANQFAVVTWKEMNQQLFSLLEMQQFALFLVLGLIVFVSMFNIVSTLVMTVHEKRQEIGILGSMGATAGFVRRVFVSYGLIVGTAGTLTGLTLGSVVCWILTRYELVSFGPEIAEVYFVSSIPFVTTPFDLGVIAAFTMTISLVASFVPSLRASRLAPIDALRHE